VTSRPRPPGPVIALVLMMSLACAPTAEQAGGPPGTGPIDDGPPAPPAADAGAPGGGADVPVAPPPRVDAAPAPVGGADAAAADGGAPPPPPPAEGAIVSAAVSGYQLLVRRRGPDGAVGAPAPFDLRGVAWSPAARGGGRPDGAAYLAAVERDAPLMRAANINVVKTYIAPPRAALDALARHGLAAIVTVLNTATEAFEPAVMQLRDHPALLMWVVGNEWNLNRLYGSCAIDDCYRHVDEAARRLEALDPNHPVATSFAPGGELPSDGDLTRLAAVDVWGLNVYSQPGFFNRFVDWRLAAQRTGVKKPFFISEYGADAFDSRTQQPDEAAQAAALRRQTQEIRAQLSARNPALPCLGGTPFEWNDEWWKRGNPGAQDPGGFAHPGVAGDGFANEEWWGVVDVDRRPRAAYQVLKELYAR
jgi:hypothetical protein